jgi:peptidyl-prolyl cis-trans isomerase D
MITGENPDPFIRQQFADADGRIDRIALRAAIEAPENSQVWIMIEQQLRDNRRQEKMGTFITSGLRVSNLDIRNEFSRNNSFADVRYVRFPFSDVSDDEITIAEADLVEYHRNNPALFQRSETFRFRYVSWDKTPTAQDTLNAIRDVEDLRGAFAMAENDSLFLRSYQSDAQFNSEYVPVDEIPEEFRAVVDLEIGEVTEVIMINDAPHIIKKIDQRGNAIKYATLTFPVIADPIGTIDRLAERAEEFEFYASSDGFEREAERRDLEIRTATATKDNPFIPGLGSSQITLDALEQLRRNRVSDPIELNDQFIVVQLLERTPSGLRPLDEVRQQVETAVRTEKRKEILYDRVRDLRAQYDDIELLAASAGKDIVVANDVRLAANNLEGAGREIKVIGSIFGMEIGQFSGPIRGENAIFVVHADDISTVDGTQISSTQRNEIRSRLEQQKFMSFNEIFIDRLKEEATIRDNRSRLIR